MVGNRRLIVGVADRSGGARILGDPGILLAIAGVGDDEEYVGTHVGCVLARRDLTHLGAGLAEA